MRRDRGREKYVQWKKQRVIERDRDMVIERQNTVRDREESRDKAERIESKQREQRIETAQKENRQNKE